MVEPKLPAKTTDPITDKIARFFKTYPLREFKKRQIVILPGEPLQKVFYITDGRVSQYDVTPTGNEEVVNIFKHGAFFPMSTALNNTPNNYFFEASTEVKAHIAPPKDVLQFLHENPDVTLDLLKRVYRGIDGVLRRMAHLMGGDAKNRLLFELLNAAYRFGESQPDGSIILGLKEGDIARHSGLARETVSRNLQSLKTAGLLHITTNGIVVKNAKELDALLGTDL